MVVLVVEKIFLFSQCFPAQIQLSLTVKLNRIIDILEMISLDVDELLTVKELLAHVAAFFVHFDLVNVHERVLIVVD